MTLLLLVPILVELVVLTMCSLFFYFFSGTTSQSNVIHKSSMDTLLAVSQITNTDDGDLRTFARSAGTNVHQIKFCVRTFAELLNKLHGIGLCHGDLSTRCVIVQTHQSTLVYK